MKLAIMGPIGSGKGTYASRISQTLGIPHLSSGQIMREEIEKGTKTGKIIKEFVEKSEWAAADKYIIELIKKRISKPDAKKGFIFDGFPRTLFQANELEKFAKLDAVILLVVPEWILVKRISSRRTCDKCGEIFNLLFLKPKKEGKCDKCGGELKQRADETEEATKKRMSEHKKLTEPVVEFYRKKGLVKEIKNNVIDTPPEPIVNKIFEALGRKERL